MSVLFAVGLCCQLFAVAVSLGRRKVVRAPLVAGAILLGLYAWRDADAVLLIGQALLAGSWLRLGARGPAREDRK